MGFKWIRVILALFVLVSYSGCATLFSGTHQSITVDSNPKGAIVEKEGFAQGSTPCTITISRWSSGDIVLSKEGYYRKEVVLTRHFNLYTLLDIPWFLLGIVPGVVAVGVDVATGAIFEYEPGHIYVQLERESERQRAPKQSTIREGTSRRDLKGNLREEPADKK